VTTIIRAGTCGSYDPQLREGSLIIATGKEIKNIFSDIISPDCYLTYRNALFNFLLAGAVRSDGVGERLIPLEYPAVCFLSSHSSA
jgi:uridine phosphorylase